MGVKGCGERHRSVLAYLEFALAATGRCRETRAVPSPCSQGSEAFAVSAGATYSELIAALPTLIPPPLQQQAGIATRNASKMHLKEQNRSFRIQTNWLSK